MIALLLRFKKGCPQNQPIDRKTNIIFNEPFLALGFVSFLNPTATYGINLFSFWRTPPSSSWGPSFGAQPPLGRAKAPARADGAAAAGGAGATGGADGESFGKAGGVEVVFSMFYCTSDVLMCWTVIHQCFTRRFPCECIFWEFRGNSSFCQQAVWNLFDRYPKRSNAMSGAKSGVMGIFCTSPDFCCLFSAFEICDDWMLLPAVLSEFREMVSWHLKNIWDTSEIVSWKLEHSDLDTQIENGKLHKLQAVSSKQGCRLEAKFSFVRNKKTKKPPYRHDINFFVGLRKSFVLAWMGESLAFGCLA